MITYTLPTSPWKRTLLAVWGGLWLLLALTFVLPSIGEDPTYDVIRTVVGAVFVVITIGAFAGYGWWSFRKTPTSERSSAIVKKPSKKVELPTVLRDRQKTSILSTPSTAQPKD